MRPIRIPLGALLALLLANTSAIAAKPPSPLRLVPDQADLVAQVPDPQRLLETVASLDLLKQIQTLEPIKEQLDSTQTRRLLQMLAYFEKELGVERKELLQRLAGGGIAVATKLGNKAPALLVLQGTDETLSRKFLKAALDVVEQELARQEIPARATRGDYQGVEVLNLGEDVHLALFQGAFLLSNKKEILRASLDLGLGKKGNSMAKHAGMTEAAKLLPKGTLASLWLNMEPVKKEPGFEAIYKTPRDPFVTVVFGGLADVLGRTPWLTGALCRDEKGLLLTFRLPRGTSGMGADKAVTNPPEGQPGSRPLLQTKGTLFSSSFYWDLSRFWTDRVALFGQERAKAIEQADTSSGTILSTVQLSKMLTAAGAYHRLVVVHQQKAGYKRQPKNLTPAAAFIVELRKPEEFSKGMETILRTGGLFASTQLSLKMVEEKYQGHDIVGYRFDEEKELPNDPTGARFNASPCFARVGNQYVFCSTLELCRQVIDQLKKEATAKDKGSPSTGRTVFFSAGGKELLRTFQDQLVASAILGQAIPLAEAKAQVQSLLGLFDQVEGLELLGTYAAKEFHFDLRLNLKK
jgi:hypothetical protein